MTFGTEHGTRVLAYLSGFCYARITTQDESPVAMNIREGRRQVYLECQRQLLTPLAEDREHTAQLEEKSDG